MAPVRRRPRRPSRCTARPAADQRAVSGQPGSGGRSGQAPTRHTHLGRCSPCTNVNGCAGRGTAPLAPWLGRPGLAALAATTGAAGTLAGGCASLNAAPGGCQLEASSFGDWPAGRAPGSYAFDRLPSQRSDTPAAERQQALEDAAGQALQARGFRPAAAGAPPDLLVQVAARVNRSDTAPWDDPLWWHGGFGAWRSHPWRGTSRLAWRVRLDTERFERSVALLLRDRASGQPLYEAHAASEGYQSSIEPAAGGAVHRRAQQLSSGTAQAAGPARAAGTALTHPPLPGAPAQCRLSAGWPAPAGRSPSRAAPTRPRAAGPGC